MSESQEPQDNEPQDNESSEDYETPSVEEVETKDEPAVVDAGGASNGG